CRSRAGLRLRLRIGSPNRTPAVCWRTERTVRGGRPACVRVHGMVWLREMLTELVILLALVVANGLFAGAEIAVLTATKARLQHASERDRRAAAVKALREQPERFLATV